MQEIEFEYTIKWCIHEPEFVRKNQTHKIFWDFEIRMDPLIPARRPDLGILTKKDGKGLADIDVPVVYGVEVNKTK